MAARKAVIIADKYTVKEEMGMSIDKSTLILHFYCFKN